MCYFAPFLQGGGILSSCNKDTDIIKNNTQNQISIADKNRAQEIKSFYLNVTSDFKSMQTYPICDASGLIESSINYFYGNGINPNNLTVVDSLLLPICGATETMNSTDISILYTDILQHLGEKIDELGRNLSNLALVDVELVLNEENSVLKIEGLFNVNQSLKSAENINEIGTTDWWYAGVGMGKCGDYSGYIGLDASDLIMSETNQIVANELNAFAQYWDDIEYVIYNYYNYPDNTHPNYNYKIFYINISPNFWPMCPECPCLSPYDNQYFTTNLIDIVETTNIGSNREVVGIADIVQTISPSIRYYKPKMKHAIRRLKDLTPPDEEPGPIALP